MKKLVIFFYLFFTFSSFACSPQQRALIHDAEKTISLRLEKIIRDWPLVDLVGVKRDFIDPEIRQWIPGSAKNQTYQTYWLKMGKIFHQMQESTKRGLNFQCMSGRDSQCKNGSIAYVIRIFGRPRQMIYLCPDFFVSNSYTTLFHELSHYSGLTEDYTLDWMNLENSDLNRAAQDAYHVEKFMHKEVSDVLRRDIWIWWWPRPKGI